jgi:outer membrane protein assembly factor BamB
VGGYWAGPWSCEDGGPERRQSPTGLDRPSFDGSPAVTSRFAPVATMAVTRDPGELYLLRHTTGEEAVSFVERIDPVTLEPTVVSPELAGGPTWPGSLAAHADGSLHVVFGNHAHRLGPDLALLASTTLPRLRPYNGFVVMGDGTIVTKDFAGSRPGTPVAAADRQNCQLVALDPGDLTVLDTCTLPEPSVARLSADADTVYVVGTTSLLRATWDGRFHLDAAFGVAYRTQEGQTYGWDCVLAGGGAWFLDNGDGSENYTGTLRGHGRSTTPLRLHRVDVADGRLTSAEVCGLSGGLVANPPVVDVERGVAVGYDSGNGVMAAFSVDEGGGLTPRWQRRQDHGAHMVLFAGPGLLVTGDHDVERGIDQAVALDVSTGEELWRVATGSPLQGVLFPAVGHDGDVYLCTFSTLTRLSP